MESVNIGLLFFLNHIVQSFHTVIGNPDLTLKIPAKFSTYGDFVEKNGPNKAKIPAKFSTYGDFIEKNGPNKAKIPAKFSTYGNFVEKNGPNTAIIPAKFSTSSDLAGIFFS